MAFQAMVQSPRSYCLIGQSVPIFGVRVQTKKNVGIFFIAFFGFAFWGYARLIYKFFSDFTKVHRFFFIAFFNQKNLFFFLMALNFFYRILFVHFFFLIAFSYSPPKVYRIFIIVSDDKMSRRRDKKIPIKNKRRGHGRS